jgi:RNA polymerase sigma-70 factor (ECF subfamily)
MFSQDKVIANRRAAFTDLARVHEASLLRAARRLCAGDDDRAQDLVQDALVRAYQAYVGGKFREGLNARAWLLRILTNLYINDYHRRRHRAETDLDALTAGGETGPDTARAAPADIPGESLLAATLDEALETALGTLSEGLRLCVLLVDVEGLDYAEAAQALNVPVGTVRSRLSRARFQLHAQLVEYGRAHGHLK